MTSARRDYLIRIDQPLRGGATYIVRKGKHVNYQNGSETPLALSNLFQEHATALQWALESALDGSAAMREIQGVLNRMYGNNKANQPQVRVLDSRKPL